MKNTSVRAGPLAILITFILMIMVGAVTGVLALRIANVAIERVHAISDRNMLLNGAYKNMQCARTGMSYLYSVLCENTDEAAKAVALASSEKGLKKVIEQTEALKDAPHIEGIDESLRQAVVQTTQTYIEVV